MVQINDGNTDLPIRGLGKLRRREARKRLKTPPLFLLTDASPEIGAKVIAAYAQVGATVQLWVDASAQPGQTAPVVLQRRTRRRR